jgi:hypothetical protein
VRSQRVRQDVREGSADESGASRRAPRAAATLATKIESISAPYSERNDAG